MREIQEKLEQNGVNEDEHSLPNQFAYEYMDIIQHMERIQTRDYPSEFNNVVGLLDSAFAESDEQEIQLLL